MAKYKFTAKQLRFIEEYPKDLNGTQAARRAGYSAHTAVAIARENLLKPPIKAAVDKILAERSAKTKIDAAWLLTRLADEATADTADLYDENGNLKSIHDWPLIWRQGLVSGMDIEVLYEGKGRDKEAVGTLTKVKLSDRAKRLEMLGKHVNVQAFKEQLDVTGKITLEQLVAASFEDAEDSD